MSKSTSRTTKLTKRHAESRFRVLVDEIKLLTVAFPHLSESFDADELPVSFLLRQGADRAARRVSPVKKSVGKEKPVARKK